MAEAYWRYDGRMPAGYQPQPNVPMKRPRPDFNDIAGGREFAGYVPNDEERPPHFVIRDNDTIGASYDRYLQTRQMPSYGPVDPARQLAGVLATRPVDDPRMTGINNVDGHNVGQVGRPEASLPPDASSTLFMEGLPSNCTRREVSHIFRPFFGFSEVRLVNKDSRRPGGDPLVLCFIDFATPAQAAIALEALQGYKFDEHEPESANLRLQFARFPGPRSASGPRGRR